MAHMKSWMKLAWLALVVAALAAGCETSTMEDQGTITLAELEGQTPEPVVTNENGEVVADVADETGGDDAGDTAGGGDAGDENEGGGGGGGGTAAGWPAEIDGPIKWLHTDVSSWPVTASLNASVGSSINMPYSKSKTWPEVDGVNANPWVIVKWTDGKWYAATFEWLRFGQTSKPKGVLDGSKGDHIKKSPLSGWRPQSGERFGLMVSGLARTQLRNVKERTNVDMVTWP